MSSQSGQATDCIFCKIISGGTPATIVAEQARVVAFQDLAPVAPVHVLIVPREHLTDAAAVGPEHGAVLAEMLEVAQHLASEADLAGGYRLVFNVGDDAGNSVAHLHLHLIGGRAMSWPPG